MSRVKLALLAGVATVLFALGARAEPPYRPAGSAYAAGVVNLNEARPDELELLPGIGPAKARAIVAHRREHAFRKVEELIRVKGIGRKTMGRLRPFLSTSGPTTLSERLRR